MAATKVLAPLDMTKLEIQNQRVHVLASAPGSPVTGQIYYDSAVNKMFFWNGSAWIDTTGGAVTFGNVTAETTFGGSSGNGALSTASRADHTHGNPTHLTADHAAVSISGLAAPTADVAWNSKKITGLLDPTAAQDAATKAYVDALAQGVDSKASVRCAATTNGTLATAYANGQTVDGQVLATGDRIGLFGQTTASENGLYIVAASGAPTRATDADASGEISKGTLVYVESGTANAGQLWVVSSTTATPWVPGSSGSTWVLYFAVTATQAGAGLTSGGNSLAVGAGTGISVAADTVGIDTAVVVRKFAASIGDGSTTSIAVTHSLGTLDVTVEVFDNSTGARVMVDVVHTSTSVVTINFSVAPTTNQYRVVVHG